MTAGSLLIVVRPEGPGDLADVRRILLHAFGGPEEADVVDTLRDADAIAVALVAEVEGRVAGHIAFTPMFSGTTGLDVGILSLAPMAVDPAFQRRGVGHALVRGGLDACREAGAGAVIVLGHPGYYPRFGFSRASGFGVRCEWDVPDEAFMAMALTPGALDDVTGVVRFRPEFAAAM